jgi:pilus assembly protein CpaE
MLQAILISPDPDLRLGMESLIRRSAYLQLQGSLDRYPDEKEIPAILRFLCPQVVFLDAVSDFTTASAIARMGTEASSFLPVALERDPSPDRMLELMNAGVRELLTPPFSEESLLRSVQRLEIAAAVLPRQCRRETPLYSFLPAKPGCGASTLAVNAALGLARTPGASPLLVDFDLSCGVVQFLLKLNHPFTVRDAVGQAAQLDDKLWGEIVCRQGQLSVLAAGSALGPYDLDLAAVRILVDEARRRHSVVCLDLSGGVEPFSVELLSLSTRIFLVMAPDLASVFLAKEKLRLLSSLEAAERVLVVLNRWNGAARLSIADMESVLGLPLHQTLPEDPQEVYEALLSAGAVDPACELGKELARLAELLAGGAPLTSTSAPRKRMVEYFSLAPARYTLFPKRA